VGGLFYLRMIVAPRLRASDAGASNDPWFAGRRGAWAMWVGIATLVLLATGFFNYFRIKNTHEPLATSYHMIAGIKILLALVVFVLAALISGRSTLAERFRQNMKFWLSACLVVAVAVVILGSVLRSYPRELKPVSGPTLIAPNN
jgi:putative copper export protein